MPSIESVTPQPIFDPRNVGASLDALREQIAVKALVLGGKRAGETPSRELGMGFELDGTREYVQGDDPRHIDWKASARQTDGTLIVREHYKDITPNLWIVSDALQSRTAFTPGYFTEQHLALSAIVATAFTGDKQGVPTGVIASNDDAIAAVHLQPGQGRRNLRKIARSLADEVCDPSPSSSPSTRRRLLGRNKAESKQATVRPRLSEVLAFAAKQCTDSLVMVVSDFRDSASPHDQAGGWADNFRMLSKRGNDVIAVETSNPYDFQLPETVSRVTSDGAVYWLGAGKKLDAVHNVYATTAAYQQTEIDAAIAAGGARHIKLSTMQPRWLDSLRLQLRNTNK